MTPLQSAIIATLAFFRLFARPLRMDEVQRWLYGMQADKSEIEIALRAMPEVREEKGFWYLQAAEYPDRVLQQQENSVLRSRIFQYLPALRHIPGIRMCAVGNTVAFDAATPDSDIDLFIVARPGMLWFVRLVATMLLHVRGVRRHGNKVAGRFCLSFFVDMSAMDLSAVAIEDDVYLRYWIATLLPVFGQETWEALQEANHTFVLEKIPAAFPLAPTGPVPVHAGSENFLLGAGNFLLRGIRWLQMSKMRHLPVKLGPGAYVVVNDHMLKFHNNDRRTYFRDQWRAILSQHTS